jgi:hypothetical protein
VSVSEPARGTPGSGHTVRRFCAPSQPSR